MHDLHLFVNSMNTNTFLRDGQRKIVFISSTTYLNLFCTNTVTRNMTQ